MRHIAAVIYDDFELLDVFGPLEMFGLLPDEFTINMVAENNQPVRSAQGPRCLVDTTFDQHKHYDILLVPGGRGSRTQVENTVLLEWLKHQSLSADYVASVCTGSALLARAGLLSDQSATSNKLAMPWVMQQDIRVNWVMQARWVESEKFFTSSGVSAGMDMSLALIAHILGPSVSQQVATWAEYEWHDDPDHDPFAMVSEEAQ